MMIGNFIKHFKGLYQQRVVLFDALNKLQILSITNKKVKLEIGVFENQSKLVDSF